MSFIQDITQPGIAPIVGAAITAVVSLNSIFLKWLINSFNGLRADIKSQGCAAARIEKATTKMLEDHEDKDQSRHEENLRRFETISVGLARLGLNGIHKGK